MEKWDLFDEKRRPLNRTHTRGNEMVIGENHIVVDIITAYFKFLKNIFIKLNGLNLTNINVFGSSGQRLIIAHL